MDDLRCATAAKAWLSKKFLHHHGAKIAKRQRPSMRLVPATARDGNILTSATRTPTSSACGEACWPRQWLPALRRAPPFRRPAPHKPRRPAPFQRPPQRPFQIPLRGHFYRGLTIVKVFLDSSLSRAIIAVVDNSIWSAGALLLLFFF